MKRYKVYEAIDQDYFIERNHDRDCPSLIVPIVDGEVDYVYSDSDDIPPPCKRRLRYTGFDISEEELLRFIKKVEEYNGIKVGDDVFHLSEYGKTPFKVVKIVDSVAECEYRFRNQVFTTMDRVDMFTKIDEDFFIYSDDDKYYVSNNLGRTLLIDSSYLSRYYGGSHHDIVMFIIRLKFVFPDANLYFLNPLGKIKQIVELFNYKTVDDFRMSDIYFTDKPIRDIGATISMFFNNSIVNKIIDENLVAVLSMSHYYGKISKKTFNEVIYKNKKINVKHKYKTIVPDDTSPLTPYVQSVNLDKIRGIMRRSGWGFFMENMNFYMNIMVRKTLT